MFSFLYLVLSLLYDSLTISGLYKQGHLSECPDVCPLPRCGEFISCGTDSWVVRWAMESHDLVWAVQVEVAMLPEVF